MVENTSKACFENELEYKKTHRSVRIIVWRFLKKSYVYKIKVHIYIFKSEDAPMKDVRELTDDETKMINLTIFNNCQDFTLLNYPR